MTTVGPVSLAISRRAAAKRTRLDRLRSADSAMRAAGLDPLLTTITVDDAILVARAEVSALISRLSDGSDEPRYAAAMTARGALGRLWEVM